MTDTYCVYRIVNVVNGKCYIGQTKNPFDRKRTHFWELRNNRHTNTHLQNAYNEYGQHSFYFEVLEKGLSKGEVDAREQYWIVEFNSFKKGYNRSEGGDKPVPRSKPCTWNGVQYPSIKTAAIANNVHAAAMRQRIRNGHKCDSDLSVANSRKCVWEGVQYPSIKAAAQASGINEEVLREYLNRGYVGEKDIPVRAKSCIWNGVKYPSIKAAARALGLHPKSMRFRVEQGYVYDEELRPRSRKCVWNGIEYFSISEAARASGITPAGMWERLRRGYTCDTDLGSENDQID